MLLTRGASNEKQREREQEAESRWDRPVSSGQRFLKRGGGGAGITLAVWCRPFFFTAPHKEPFDISLMESAEPTFWRPSPFPAARNGVRRHAGPGCGRPQKAPLSTVNPGFEQKEKKGGGKKLTVEEGANEQS